MEEHLGEKDEGGGRVPAEWRVFRGESLYTSGGLQFAATDKGKISVSLACQW